MQTNILPIKFLCYERSLLPETKLSPDQSGSKTSEQAVVVGKLTENRSINYQYLLLRELYAIISEKGSKKYQVIDFILMRLWVNASLINELCSVNG